MNGVDLPQIGLPVVGIPQVCLVQIGRPIVTGSVAPEPQPEAFPWLWDNGDVLLWDNGAEVLIKESE